MEPKIIEPGYIASNGYVFTAYDCKKYNRITSRLIRCKKENFPIPKYKIDEMYICYKCITKMAPFDNKTEPDWRDKYLDK